MWGAHDATRMLMISRRRQACDTAFGPSTGARYQDRWREKKVRACHPQRTLNNTRFAGPRAANRRPVVGHATAFAAREAAAARPHRERPPSLASEQGAPAGGPVMVSGGLGGRAPLPLPSRSLVSGHNGPGQTKPRLRPSLAPGRLLLGGGMAGVFGTPCCRPIGSRKCKAQEPSFALAVRPTVNDRERSVLWVGRWQN